MKREVSCDNVTFTKRVHKFVYGLLVLLLNIREGVKNFLGHMPLSGEGVDPTSREKSKLFQKKWEKYIP